MSEGDTVKFTVAVWVEFIANCDCENHHSHFFLPLIVNFYSTYLALVKTLQTIDLLQGRSNCQTSRKFIYPNKNSIKNKTTASQIHTRLLNIFYTVISVLRNKPIRNALTAKENKSANQTMVFHLQGGT